MVGTATTGRPLVSAIALPKPMVEPPPTVTQQSAPRDLAISRASFTAPAGACITTLSKTPATLMSFDSKEIIADRPGVESMSTRFAPSRSNSAGNCATEPAPNTTRDGRPV